MSRKSSKEQIFERVYLLGTGLIGGSLALDLKDRGLVREVVGSDALPERSRSAVSIGILDDIQRVINVT